MASEGDVAEPRDLAEARLLISTLTEQLQRTRRENELLKHKLDVLCRRLFGKKSERVDAAQLRLALDLLESEPQVDPESLETGSGEDPRPRERKVRHGRSTGRQELPRQLVRQVVTRDVPEAERVCACGAEKRVIGEDVSEKLEYVPASFHVIQTRRIKRACPKGHGVSVAPAPAQAVEKSLAAEGLRPRWSADHSRTGMNRLAPVVLQGFLLCACVGPFSGTAGFRAGGRGRTTSVSPAPER